MRGKGTAVESRSLFRSSINPLRHLLTVTSISRSDRYRYKTESDGVDYRFQRQ